MVKATQNNQAALVASPKLNFRMVVSLTRVTGAINKVGKKGQRQRLVYFAKVVTCAKQGNRL